MNSEILSATLPKDSDIRDTLIAELRERFDGRLVVLDGCVFVLPESERGNDIEIGAESAQILAGAGLRIEDEESIAFAGSDAEKRLSRVILAYSTRAMRRKSGPEMVSRRFSSRKNKSVPEILRERFWGKNAGVIFLRFPEPKMRESLFACGGGFPLRRK